MSEFNEPWSLDRALEICDARGKTVARLIATLGKYEPEEENAKRIIACVNFCAGKSTEILETASAYDKAEADAEFSPPHPIFRLAARNDAMHEALLKVRQAFRENDTSSDKAHPWIPGADAKRVIAIIEEALR